MKQELYDFVAQFHLPLVAFKIQGEEKVLTICAPRGAVLLAAENASPGSGDPPHPVSSLGLVWVTNPVKRRQRGDRP